MRTLFLASASVSVVCCASSAAAQQVEPRADDEIIVTGEKAERSLQDTTASIAVTTPKRIEQENLVSLQDVLQRTANVTETYGVSGFTIRGMNNRGVSGVGEGAALATIFVDGAALPSNVLQSAPSDMWDVQQIEILRGPQSTLQGLNALAGAILIQTTEPTMKWSVHAKAMVTDETATQFAIAGGGPIIPGELAFRISVEKRDGDGFTFNPTRNTEENPLDSTNFRGKLLWQPSVLPGFEARLGYTRFERFGGYAFSYTDTSVPNYFERRRNFSNDPNASDLTTDIATADLRYDVGGGFSLTALTTYNIVNEYNLYDNDLTAADNGSYTQRNRFKTLSQELRLNYEDDRISALLGGFFYDRNSRVATTSLTTVTTPVSTISLLLQGSGVDAATADSVAGLYGTALPRIPVNFASDGETNVQTYALFGDTRIKLTDRLSLIAGFRYDHEKNNVAVAQRTGLAGPLPDPGAFGPVGSPLYLAVNGINGAVTNIVGQATGSAVAVDRTFSAFLPKGGIEMAWNDDIKTAFTVQRGYRSGGASSNLARSATFAYDPEFTWNYELSFRSQWLDGALTLNANAFYIDWTDQQVTANFGLNEYDTNIVNAGKSHLYGFEVELAHRVSPAFDWYANVGHTRTKFDEFTATVGSVTDLSGLEFQHAPHWTLAAGINVRPLDKLRFNLNANHRSEVFAEITRPQTVTRIVPRTLVNARVAYDIGTFTVSAFASNLFDEQYFQYRRDGLARGVLGAPRVFGAAIEARW